MVSNWVPVVLAAFLSAVGLGLAALGARTRATLRFHLDVEASEDPTRRAAAALAVLVFAVGGCIALLPSSEPGWGISGGLAILACTWPAAAAIAYPQRAWMAGLSPVIIGVAIGLGWVDAMWRISFLSVASFLPLVFVLVSVVSPSAAKSTPGVGGNLTER